MDSVKMQTTALARNLRVMLRRSWNYAILTSLVALILYGIFSFRMADFQQTPKSGEDLRCYYAIAERIHSGEGYYQAARQELQTRGYATDSVFNWRLPFLATLLGTLPSQEAGQVIVILLSFFSLWLWVDVATQRMSFPRVALGVIPLAGSAVYSFIEIIFVMHELWAGILISISLLAHGKGWWKLSLAAGITALFIRELVLPFVAVMFLASLADRNRKEAIAWLLGVLAFLSMLAFHSKQVHALTHSNANLNFAQWLALSGWDYVLATIQVQPFLFIFPSWCTAVLAPFALLGFLAWRDALGRRMGLTIAAYILIFLFVGRNNNAYWGLLYCNLVPLGLLYVPVALSDTLSLRRVNRSLTESAMT